MKAGSHRARGELTLEVPSPKRKREFLDLAKASKSLHRGWVRPPATAPEFAAYIKSARKPNKAGFFLCEKAGGGLVGVVNVNEIVRGLFQSAYLGFYIFAPFANRGYMTMGLALVLDAAFGKLGLHRVEANIQPGNAKSRKVVKRLGFRREGVSRRYLRIGGAWRDHERWALTKEEWK